MNKNLFIAFEGIDGCGKSTQVKLLAERLAAAGHKVHITVEPTDRFIGALIRKIFRHELAADHRTIAGLFVADRLDHLLNEQNGLIRLMQEGHIIITDRYLFSSYAYQGAHMAIDWVIGANSLAAGLLSPDLNIFIDIPPEVGMRRINVSRSTTELYETIENLTAVRDNYLKAFEKLRASEKIFITDGNRPAEEIAGDIWEKISHL